jgi:hypothetical protein
MVSEGHSGSLRATSILSLQVPRKYRRQLEKALESA